MTGLSKLVVRNLKPRHTTDLMVRIAATLGAAIGLLILVWILWIVLQKGIGALNHDFFTKLPAPPGVVGGGLANAIIGTVIMTVLASVTAIPIGILAGVYLAEFGRGEWFSDSVRFLTNVMIGVPSIIVGVFVYTLLVVPFRSFSGFAGAASLAIIMLPVIVRTTEDMLRMVPDALREAGLALGAPRWKVTLQIVFRAASGGMLTGVLLAVARVSGETAPLLFTALNSPYWLRSLAEPTGNLTVTIFNYAMSPYKDWQMQAWGASLLIMSGVLLLTALARMILLGQKGHR